MIHLPLELQNALLGQVYPQLSEVSYKVIEGELVIFYVVDSELASRVEELAAGFVRRVKNNIRLHNYIINVKFVNRDKNSTSLIWTFKECLYRRLSHEELDEVEEPITFPHVLE